VRLSLGRLAATAALSVAVLLSPAPLAFPQTETRRIAIRAPEALTKGQEAERLAGWARRQGVRLDVAGEATPVPPGWEVVRIGVAPASADLVRRLARFGVKTTPAGFTFDGRSYAGAEDAIGVRDPAAASETLVFGNGRSSAFRMFARRVFFRGGDGFGGGAGAPTDYQVASGELAKRGRFLAGSLAIDRKTDRDEIGARDEFFRTLTTLERGGIRWRFHERDRAALDRLEKIAARFRRRATVPLTIRVFPDPAMKAQLTGSSRPADVVREDGAPGIRVDVDASAPAKPDTLSPAFAAAAFAAEDPALLARPYLLLALGARAAGRFWEREVAGFEAFARRAGVEMTPADVLHGEDDVSPIVAVGSVAAWLDVGIRREGEAAVLRVLGGPEPALVAAFDRWRAEAAGARFEVPRRRPLPPGFLRGVSYAMSNSIESGYASPKSGETLGRLAKLGTTSISVMPFSFQPDAARPPIAFVHRNPQGETDEGTLHAVANAHALGMTAMLKPQIWVGHDEFVGRIAMASEPDWAKWFAAYRKFAVHHALVAEASDSDLYCIGTELLGTESHAREWRELAAAVRLATGTPLTYAANWAGGAVKVSFWDALDAIGVDFYDPLSAKADATDAELEAGARQAASPLAGLSRKTGRPVLFTEAGYPLARSAWLAPHDENTGRPPAPGDAARAMAALTRALERESWWKGVYWWKAFSSGRDARPEERGFNVLGGACEKALVESFDRLAKVRK
jgi:hypothetical protein